MLSNQQALKGDAAKSAYRPSGAMIAGYVLGRAPLGESAQAWKAGKCTKAFDEDMEACDKGRLLLQRSSIVEELGECPLYGVYYLLA